MMCNGMSHTILKQDLANELWLKKLFRVWNAIKFTRFCCLFSLRQGTILVGFVDLTMTSFYLLMLLLGATHAQDLVAMVTSDLLQLEERKLSEVGIEDQNNYLLNNERKMILGQHLAFLLMFIVWAGLLMASINFIACTLMLYGAIRNIPNLILPWASIALFNLVSWFFFIILLTFMPLQDCKPMVLAIIISFYILELYAWLTVFSYYHEMKA